MQTCLGAFVVTWHCHQQNYSHHLHVLLQPLDMHLLLMLDSEELHLHLRVHSRLQSLDHPVCMKVHCLATYVCDKAWNQACSQDDDHYICGRPNHVTIVF